MSTSSLLVRLHVDVRSTSRLTVVVALTFAQTSPSRTLISSSAVGIPLLRAANGLLTYARLLDDALSITESLLVDLPARSVAAVDAGAAVNTLGAFKLFTLIAGACAFPSRLASFLANFVVAIRPDHCAEDAYRRDHW